jgi:cellulose synthase/poly-beta-1,6-N-acetylglucosamine synthase-like glycosyltransferase
VIFSGALGDLPAAGAAARDAAEGLPPVSAPPLVSIGLPVYNGERFLAQALDSLLGQTLGDLEIIVSDNASTDRTAEICKDYAARDARIRYIRQESPDLVLSRNRYADLLFCRFQRRADVSAVAASYRPFPGCSAGTHKRI